MNLIESLLFNDEIAACKEIKSALGIINQNLMTLKKQEPNYDWREIEGALLSTYENICRKFEISS